MGVRPWRNSSVTTRKNSVRYKPCGLCGRVAQRVRTIDGITYCDEYLTEGSTCYEFVSRTALLYVHV
jgi:hypothetical protein